MYALATKVNLAKRIPGFGMKCEICALDYLEHASTSLDPDKLGEFVAVLWECWNARNRFIFGRRDSNWRVLAGRAVSFVRRYRELKSMPAAPDEGGGACWVPPSAGVFKLNFDAGRVGTKERGCGFVIRDHLKNVVVAGVKQGQGFHGAEFEEAGACLFP
ncbi:hypothetical protein Cgig2_018089 [Carnegiea gigantea]|uniref:Uncharacterized protein n=1 Tax=Carnegiea gigantea TaxID=171969 RepID=A0A9Q1JZ63_9CARY|nr:hypothetical protein Cgig2_018089 [Carnegiea gigantea]